MKIIEFNQGEKNPIPKGKMTTHQWIMKLRGACGLDTEEESEEELERERREMDARTKRLELAVTEENYIKLFNRDPWTDRWLGPGPEEPMPFLDETPKEMKERQKREHEEWKEKYLPKVPKVSMPTFEKESKKVKKLRKKRKEKEEKQSRQKKYDIVYWYLEIYLKPSYADEMWFSKYDPDDFEQMVDDCYEEAIQWYEYIMKPRKSYTYKEYNKLWEKGETKYQQKLAEMEDDKLVVNVDGDLKFKRLEDAEKHRAYIELDPDLNPCPEIPDEYEEEYKAWCKKHPLKKYEKKFKKQYPFCIIKRGIGPMSMRDRDFLEKINKRNRKFRHGLWKHDYLTGSQFSSKEELVKWQKKQQKKYEKTNDEFVKVLDDMYERGWMSEDMYTSWADRSKKALKVLTDHQKFVRKRYEENKDKYAREAEHEKRFQKERKEWFKKFGSDIKDTQYLVLDGEKVKIERLKSDMGDRYKVHRKHSTRYGPRLEDLW